MLVAVGLALVAMLGLSGPASAQADNPPRACVPQHEGQVCFNTVGTPSGNFHYQGHAKLTERPVIIEEGHGAQDVTDQSICPTFDPQLTNCKAKLTPSDNLHVTGHRNHNKVP